MFISNKPWKKNRNFCLVYAIILMRKSFGPNSLFADLCLSVEKRIITSTPNWVHQNLLLCLLIESLFLSLNRSASFTWYISFFLKNIEIEHCGCYNRQTKAKMSPNSHTYTHKKSPICMLQLFKSHRLIGFWGNKFWFILKCQPIIHLILA